MEKIQFWRLFTRSPLWDSAQGAFKSWVIPPSSGHGIILLWWAVGMQMMLLSKHTQGPVTPVTLVALHPLSWLPLDASVSTEWVLFRLLIKILVPEASLSSRLQLWANAFVQSRMDWYQIIKVISCCQPCLLCPTLNHREYGQFWTTAGALQSPVLHHLAESWKNYTGKLIMK